MAEFPHTDGKRLSRQLDAVRALMLGEALGPFDEGVPCRRWWTFAELRHELQHLGIAASEAGISARIRDLRKAKCGGYEVERRRVKGGLWEYRVKREDEGKVEMGEGGQVEIAGCRLLIADCGPGKGTWAWNGEVE